MRHVFHRLKTWRRDASGASAVEFAIVATVFFTLVFGIVIYGSYFASLSLVNHIASEAARASVAGLSDAERGTLAHARADELIASLGGLLDTDSIEVDAEPAATEGIYEVTVRHHFDAFGLMNAISILPMPPADQSATVQVSHGGY